MNDLVSLFQPKNVALIGASSNPKKYGYWTAKSLIEHGFNGDIYFISRSGGKIFGYPVYPDILALPQSVDLAIIAIAPKYILPIIEQCAEKGVKCVIVVSTGFGETGPEGKEIERRMLEIGHASGMRIMGPNCMGMYSSSANLNTSIIDLAPGPLSLILQSGNFGIDLNIHVKSRGLGYACWATIGNQLDIRFHDFINYIGTDERTRVLMLYMEGLRVESEKDGRRFLDVARRVSQEKPIVAIKIGRSSAGVRAAASHTGSLAGSEVLFDAALRQSGIIRVDTPIELLDVAETFANCKPAKGKRIAILTDGGGHGVMATDMAERFGLVVPVLSEATQKKLHAVLKPHCPVKNPVDLAGTPEEEMWVFDRCLKILLETDEVDGVVIVGLYGGYADLSGEFKVLEIEIAKSMAKQAAKSDKAVLMHSIYHSLQPECLCHLAQNGVPVFGDIESTMQGMGALVQYAGFKTALAEEVNALPPQLPVNRREKVRAIFERVRAQERVNLIEPEAREVLAAYGFRMPEYFFATSPDEAFSMYEKLGGEVAMKIVSPEILHKTEANGVLLGIHSADAAYKAYDILCANGKTYDPKAEIAGVLITPMLTGGVECIIGSTFDVTFGATVMFGLGGIFVEILKDVSFRVAPVNMPQGRAMLKEIKGLPLLEGARGAKPANLEALADAVSRLSYLAYELAEDIAEVDMNPVFATEQGVDVLDVRIVLHER